MTLDQCLSPTPMPRLPLLALPVTATAAHAQEARTEHTLALNDTSEHPPGALADVA